MNDFKPEWLLEQTIDAVVFDCDGTLTRIEGIDELANQNGVGKQVTQMTAAAMSKTGLSPELYDQRLQLVQPTQQQVINLAQTYFAERMQDVEELIRLLQTLNKRVFIISAGVNPAVTLFGCLLGVPEQQIYAVDLYFDAAGHYVDFDRSSDLVRNQGKRHIIAKIQQHYPRLLYTGDGLNDLQASDMVTRFVGYGGIYYRENIAAQCEYYLHSTSLAGLLPLALTAKEIQQFSLPSHKLYVKGLECLHDCTHRTITGV